MPDPAADDDDLEDRASDRDDGPLPVLELDVVDEWVPVRALGDTGGWYVLAGGPATRFPYELLRRGKVRYRLGGATRWSRVSIVGSVDKRTEILTEFQRRAGAAEFARWFPEPGRLLRLGLPSDAEPSVTDAYGDWLRGEFDAGAAGYAARIAENPIERSERRRTTEALRRSFPTPARLLELGSGPGPETVDLLGDGHTVTAIDLSNAMLEALRRRAEAAGVDGRLRLENRRLASIDGIPGAPFDGAYSTFGALNCEPDLGRVALALAGVLRPGALFVAGVFNSLALPELLGGGLTGRWRRATARLHRPVAAERSRFGVDWYAYRVATFTTPFCRSFDLESVASIGVIVPPPDAVDRWPGLAPWVGVLDRWDARLGRAPGFRSLGDQLLLRFRRRKDAR